MLMTLRRDLSTAKGSKLGQLNPDRPVSSASSARRGQQVFIYFHKAAGQCPSPHKGRSTALNQENLRRIAPAKEDHINGNGYPRIFLHLIALPMSLADNLHK